MHRLSDRLQATYNDEDSSIHFDVKIKHLSDDELFELKVLWEDGLCPVCLDEINQGHEVCINCAKKEIAR